MDSPNAPPPVVDIDDPIDHEGGPPPAAKKKRLSSTVHEHFELKDGFFVCKRCPK